MMDIISVVPRGYCQGVVHAIQTARSTADAHPDEPIYMLGMIVHNRHVVDECRKLGIIPLEDPHKTRMQLLDEIDHGIVIFTAHGVSDEVYQKARDKGLEIVDATCRDVAKTHDLVRAHCRNGDVIYIGKKNHPEAEGVVGISSRVHLVSDLHDIDALPESLENILITNQTTLSILDTRQLVEACRKKFPDAQVMDEICNATTIRQKAVMALKDTDVLIVVGDPHSNNSNQLRQIGLSCGILHAYLIDDITGLKEEMIKGVGRVAVTSGSSTPNSLTAQVIAFLKQYAETGIFNPPTAPAEGML